ncbi:MAG: FAD/NAD(P)-binding oxidoreductase [bacterium]|nr:FAD/NAD(P)-binding oxidoreductase [bacterium]
MALAYDYLIIGGGIAGTSAAEAIRKLDPGSKIAILEDEGHLLYSRVFLPSYARGEMPLEKVMLRRLEDYSRQKIDVYLSETAKQADFSRREVFSESSKVFSYKKLLIAAGGRVRPWEFELEFKDRILRLQTLDDARRILELGSAGRLRRVVVLGGGFIMLEFLNIFRKYGCETTLLCRDDYFWKGQVEERGGRFFEELFSRNRVRAFWREEVSELGRVGSDIQVLTKNGLKLAADWLAVGIGLKRSCELVQGISETGAGIRVNEFLEVPGVSDVWAAGDVMEYFDAASGRFRTVGNWTHAFYTGHLAGENMTGKRLKFSSVPAYSIKVLDSVATFVGEVDEKFADRTFVRELPFERKYARFFLKEGRLIGAVLLNAWQSKPVLTRLIESGRTLSENDLTLS